MAEQEIRFAFRFDCPAARTKAQWLATIADIAAKLNALKPATPYVLAPDASYEGGITFVGGPGIDAGHYKALRMYAHTKVREEGNRQGCIGDQSMSATALAAMADDTILLPSLSRVDIFTRRDTATQSWSRAEVGAVRAALAADYTVAPKSFARPPKPPRAAAATKPRRK